MLIRSPKALGALIKDRRQELGLNQAELAERAGTTRHWIIDVERGKPTVELARVLRTLEVLELELDVRPREKAPSSTSPQRESVAVPVIDIDAIIQKAKRSE